MARYCHGANAPYGCGHHAEHVEAAKKGWITRRRGQRGAEFEGSESQRHVSTFLGETISLAHTHPEHKGIVVFKSKGKWYELPQRTFNSYVRGGRQMARDRAKSQAQSEKQTRLQRNRELREQIGQERMESAYAARERADVVSSIAAIGGIRPDKIVGGQGHYGRRNNRSEWLMLPAQVRNTKSHYTLDVAAQQIEEEFPHLNIRSGDDLLAYFDRSDYRLQNARSRRKSLEDELALNRVRAPRKKAG